MSKAELVEKMADKFPTKKEAETALDTLVAVLDETLTKEGDTVTLQGLGIFKVAKRPARTGRNPKTGATIQIPETLVLKFKQSKTKKFA